ncbi:hypothetical protein D3C87_1664350 [compost metagenome]
MRRDLVSGQRVGIFVDRVQHFLDPFIGFVMKQEIAQQMDGSEANERDDEDQITVMPQIFQESLLVMLRDHFEGIGYQCRKNAGYSCREHYRDHPLGFFHLI